MDVHTPEYEFEDTIDLYVYYTDITNLCVFHSLINFRNVNVNSILQSVKLLMLRYMATPLALRLGDDDTATDDVVAICLRLAVLLYDLRSKPGTFTGMESSIQV
ncbi:hypothetical protein TNCV_2624701 [Trichonephila clavipes]|nr:hypothetical protein TNCV_2624701 [Trichonephila clavipes]